MNKTTIFHPFKGETVAIHRFAIGQSPYPPVLLVHGSIESGKIFYSSSGKGFAPFLAQNGFDVFVVDLRGKGASTPAVSRKSTASQTDTILEEIPSVIQKIKEVTGSDSIHLGAHSWGGVLLLSAYALFYEQWKVKSMIFFGTKRRIGIRNFEKFTKIDLGWCAIGSLSTLLYGYLPAKALKMGSDDEPATFYREVNKWVYRKNWIDIQTRFDYRQKLQTLTLPPIHFYTGIHDRLLGNPEDVKRLAAEVNQPEAVKILGKQNGNLHNYDHINILTHPDAVKDHFVEVAELYKKYSV